jgi:hypothetical protein
MRPAGHSSPAEQTFPFAAENDRGGVMVHGFRQRVWRKQCEKPAPGLIVAAAIASGCNLARAENCPDNPDALWNEPGACH